MRDTPPPVNSTRQPPGLSLELERQPKLLKRDQGVSTGMRGSRSVGTINGAAFEVTSPRRRVPDILPANEKDDHLGHVGDVVGHALDMFGEENRREASRDRARITTHD